MTEKGTEEVVILQRKGNGRTAREALKDLRTKLV
jgi:hypothetical protein